MLRCLINCRIIITTELPRCSTSRLECPSTSRLECPSCLSPLNIHQSRTIQSWVANPSLQPSLQHPLRTFCFKSVFYLLTYLLTYLLLLLLLLLILLICVLGLLLVPAAAVFSTQSTGRALCCSATADRRGQRRWRTSYC